MVVSPLHYLYLKPNDVWLLIFHLDQTLIEKMAEIFDSLLFRINISKSGEILTKLSNLKIFGLKVLNQGKSFENLWTGDPLFNHIAFGILKETTMIPYQEYWLSVLEFTHFPFAFVHHSPILFFYTPWKTSENLWSFDIFRGYRNGILVWKRLMVPLL